MYSEKTKNKRIAIGKLLFVISIIFLICCPIVSGETLTGTLSQSGLVSNNYEQYHAGGGSVVSWSQLYTTDITNTGGLSALVIYPGAYNLVEFGTNASGSTPVSFKIGGVTVGNGTYGYQRLFNWLGTETGSYMYFTISDWNVQGLTGAKVIDIYPSNFGTLAGFKWSGYQGSTSAAGSGLMAYYSAGGAFPYMLVGHTGSTHDLYIENVRKDTYNTYSFTKPSGLGVTGTISRTVLGVNYPTRAFITSPNGNVIYASEASTKTTDFVLNTIYTSFKVALYTPYNTWVNSSTLFDSSEIYTLTVNPTTGKVNDTFTGTITSSSGTTTSMRYFALYDTTDLGSVQSVKEKNTVYDINYLKNTSGYWNGWDSTYLNEYGTYGGYVRNKGLTAPNPFTFTFDTGGNHTLKLTVITTDEKEYTAYSNATISGAGVFKTDLFPLDYTNNEFVVGTDISVQSYPDRVWYNKTVYNPNDCRWILNLGFYNVWTHAEGYENKYHGAFYLNENYHVEHLIMKPSQGSTNISESIVYIGVKEPENLYPISGATVTITPSNSIAKTTQAGIATFLLVNGTQYKATATASGYKSTSVTFTPNSASYSFDIAMGSDGVVPTAVTPIITTRTTVPVITPSAWTQGNASTCGHPAKNNSFIDWLKSEAACNGFEDSVSQSLLVAGFIMFLAMGVGYGLAKIVGACIGASIGFIMAWVAGLIPFFVLVAIIIILVCVVAALLAIKASSGG